MKKRKMKTAIIPGVILAGLIPVSGMALEIKEGKWGFTTNRSDPMTGQMVEEYSEECIMGDYDPVAEMQEGMAQMGTMCEVEPVTDAASEFEANMSCPLPDNMGEFAGNIHFTVDGESAVGKVAMSVDMGGMSMDIAIDTNGEYLGACDG